MLKPSCRNQVRSALPCPSGLNITWVRASVMKTMGRIRGNSVKICRNHPLNRMRECSDLRLSAVRESHIVGLSCLFTRVRTKYPFRSFVTCSCTTEALVTCHVLILLSISTRSCREIFTDSHTCSSCSRCEERRKRGSNMNPNQFHQNSVRKLVILINQFRRFS
jgi:hypothetical protein